MAVLDACVLVPSGLRDLLLSCAATGLLRPVWQSEILDEVRRNGSRLLVKRRDLSQEDADAALDHTLTHMRRAFFDAEVDSILWVPLVPSMTNDIKDRHVLAVGVGASCVVTSNLSDFPESSWPPCLVGLSPDEFLLGLIEEHPKKVRQAVESMSARLSRPAQSPTDLAKLFENGQHTVRNLAPSIVDLRDRPTHLQLILGVVAVLLGLCG